MSLFDQMSRLEKLLDYHLARHTLLASNVSNVETPGFKSKDLRFNAELSRAMDTVKVTSERHLGASTGTERAMRAEIFEDAIPDGLDKSAAMEREMAKMSANSLRYEMTAELVRRRMALLRYAAQDGGQ